MVKLTVLLIRSAETEDERLPAQQQMRLTNATVNGELKDYIQNQAQDETGVKSNGQRSLSARVDPPLTVAGYEQAQICMTAVLDAVSAGDPTRKMALFSAPTRACASTAVMLSCADIEYRTSLTWRLTTMESAEAPMAIPIVVSNGLCNADPDIITLGGATAAVETGLMHCAGMPFNDARTKCPLMKVFKKIKEGTQERIDDWDEARDESGKKIHHINHLQFLRIEQPQNPWSLQIMTPKINILVDFIEPKRYMLTPRKGMFDPQKAFSEWKDGVLPSIRQTTWWARQAGCDTVVIVCSGAAMTSMAQACNAAMHVAETPPCCLTSYIVEVPDHADSRSQLTFSFYRYSTLNMLCSKGQWAIPAWPGPINELMAPDPSKDPANAPQNKWAAFPDPEPEVIPPGYPDLPNFMDCLDMPLPPPPKKKATTGPNPNAPNKKKR